MLTRFRVIRATTAFCLVGAVVGSAWAEGRTVKEILKDIDANPVPKYDQAKIKTNAQMRELVAKMNEAMEVRGKLAWELFEVDPNNDKLVDLLGERWAQPLMNPATRDDALAEIAKVKAKTKNAKIKATADYVDARAQLITSARGEAEAVDKADKAVDAFVSAYPKDERSAELLGISGLLVHRGDEKKQVVVFKRIIKDYPDSVWAKRVEGSLKLLEAVGKPVELVFEEAISGKNISLQKDLRGKIVVLDFWATWCGPCVAEMPKMKDLYKEFHPQGVEFIGVSLDHPKDQGGLDSLKKFVKEKEIPWPQYYQGNGWESDFSSSWGITAIPALFVVGPDGKIVTAEGRGKLESLLPELIKKAKGSPHAGE